MVNFLGFTMNSGFNVRGGKIPPREHAKLLVEDDVEYILDRLILSKLGKAGQRIHTDSKYDVGQMPPMWIGASHSSDLKFFDTRSVNDPLIVWPVDCGVVYRKHGDDKQVDLQLLHFSSVVASELRGKYFPISRTHNVLLRYAILLRDGNFYPSKFVSSLHGKWIFSRRTNEVGGIQVNSPLRFNIGDFAQTLALTYRYEWGAQFSVGNSPKLILPVTPAGVLELFNDRNKPEEADRRAALRHWVKQHLRLSGRGDFATVRSHLRGNMRFSWRGFDVVIRPSAFDEALNSQGGVN